MAEGDGWRLFAGIILIVASIMRFIDSIWAFGYHGALPEGLDGGTLGDNLTTYAWVHLIVAVILLIAGFLVLARAQFGRWAGIVAAAMAMIAAATWLPYYPVWSLIYIAISGLVIYALAVYGGPEQADRVAPRPTAATTPAATTPAATTPAATAPAPTTPAATSPGPTPPGDPAT